MLGNTSDWNGTRIFNSKYILHANNTRDIKHDADANIKTQAMLLGVKNSIKTVYYTWYWSLHRYSIGSCTRYSSSIELNRVFCLFRY